MLTIASGAATLRRATGGTNIKQTKINKKFGIKLKLTVGKPKTFCLADEPIRLIWNLQNSVSQHVPLTHLFKSFGRVKATKEWKQMTRSHVLSLARVYLLLAPYLARHLAPDYSAPGEVCSSEAVFCTARAQACA